MMAGVAVLWLAFASWSAAVAAESETLTGIFVAVADGDTLTLLVGHEQVRVRQKGIDAPERGQLFGTRAGEALAEMVHGKTVTVRSIGTDRYGRALGWVLVRSDDGEMIDVNARLVEQGFAW